MKRLLFLIFIFASWLSGKTAVIFTDDGFMFTTRSGNEVGVHQYGGKLEGELVIPSHITYEGVEYTVKYIEYAGFAGCHNVTSIVIPNTVTRIYSRAFEACDNATRIEIPNSVTRIDSDAFKNCKSLENVVIPNSLTTLETKLFDGCTGLKSVVIPPSITKIVQSFSGCTGLEKVIISDLSKWCKISFGDEVSNPLFYAHHLYLNDEEITELVVPDDISTMGRNAFSNCTGLKDIIFHDHFTGFELGAFRGCTGLTNLNLPNSIKSINQSVFEGCSGIETIKFPENLEEIGQAAFMGCSSLQSLDFPESLSKINGNAFRDCTSLQSVILGPNIIFAPYLAFMNCPGLIKSAYPDHLENPFESGVCIAYPSPATVENGVVYSQDKTGVYFASMDLQGELSLPQTIKTIGPQTFLYCKDLTSIILPETVEAIGDYAFAGCENLSSIVIPYSTNKLGNNCFEGCNSLIKNAYPDWFENPFESGLSISYPRGAYFEDGCIYNGNRISIYFAPLSLQGSYSIKESVMNVEANAFYACEGLTDIVIPNKVTKVGDNAFMGCSAIESVTCLAPVPPKAEDNIFDDKIYRNAQFLVPESSFEEYALSEPWGYFYNIGILEGLGDNDTSGVEEIDIDQTTNYKVYSIEGKKILETAKSSDINNLPKGLYIVNGKKVLISK